MGRQCGRRSDSDSLRQCASRVSHRRRTHQLREDDGDARLPQQRALAAHVGACEQHDGSVWHDFTRANTIGVDCLRRATQLDVIGHDGQRITGATATSGE